MPSVRSQLPRQAAKALTRMRLLSWEPDSVNIISVCPAVVKKSFHRRRAHESTAQALGVGAAAWKREGLIRTPGPMVVASTAALDILALGGAGRARTMAPISVSKFSLSFSGPKETLPIGQWMMLVLSSLYSILPALASVTARPHRASRCRPWGWASGRGGPEACPAVPPGPSYQGWRSVHRSPSSFRTGSFAPYPRRPQNRRRHPGRRPVVAFANHQNPHRFARSVGQHHGAADLLVRVAGIDAQPDMDLHRFVKLRFAGLNAQADGLARVVQLGFIKKLCAFGIFLPCFILSILSVVYNGYFLPLRELNRRLRRPCSWLFPRSSAWRTPHWTRGGRAFSARRSCAPAPW